MEQEEVFFGKDGSLKLDKRGKLRKKEVCHDCLNSFDLKFLFNVTRNNFGIPHTVNVCKNCKKKYD